MTKPWRVDVVQCRGSAYDVGKQMATAFLATPRGRAYGRRKERRPFAFSLKNVETALETWAPNIWRNCTGSPTALPSRSNGPSPNTRTGGCATNGAAARR